MVRLAKLAILSTALALPVALSAQDGPSPEERALTIRQAHMMNFAANLGRLGAMAQEEAEYDAAVAQAAADNIHHLAMIQWDYYWPPGTAEGEIEGSEALPAIWENMEDFEAKHVALQEAATALQAAAGTDLASLQGAMQGVGQACGGCHENYRVKQE